MDQRSHATPEPVPDVPRPTVAEILELRDPALRQHGVEFLITNHRGDELFSNPELLEGLDLQPVVELLIRLGYASLVLHHRGLFPTHTTAELAARCFELGEGRHVLYCLRAIAAELDLRWVALASIERGEGEEVANRIMNFPEELQQEIVVAIIRAQRGRALAPRLHLCNTHHRSATQRAPVDPELVAREYVSSGQIDVLADLLACFEEIPPDVTLALIDHGRGWDVQQHPRSLSQDSRRVVTERFTREELLAAGFLKPDPAKRRSSGEHAARTRSGVHRRR